MSSQTQTTLNLKICLFVKTYYTCSRRLIDILIMAISLMEIKSESFTRLGPLKILLLLSLAFS